MKKRVLVSILLIGLLLLMIGTVSADVQATCTWTGATDTDWGTTSNWSGCGGVVPDGDDTVIIPGGLSNYPIVSLSDNIDVDNLTVDAGASLDLNGRSINVDDTLINNGTLIDRRTINTVIPSTFFFATGDYLGLILSRNIGGGLSNPGVVEVMIKGNQSSCTTGSTTIGRCFEINPTVTSNISINAAFVFDPAELNGLDCNTLSAFRFNGSTWEPAGSHIVNDCETSFSPQYSVTMGNITDFSPFVVSSGTPTAVNLIDFAQSSSWTIMVVIGAALLLLTILTLFVGAKKFN